MNELALFAGAGGGILGGKLLGWTTVGAVELDPYAASVLVARQNEGILAPFPIWDDVRTFDGYPWRGFVDVISGGFPCTDISIAGAGAGIEGDESKLWGEMARIIGEVRPTYALIENSPALTFRGGVRVIADLAAMGYDCRWGIISAADAIWLAGRPCIDHLRDRIWIAASRADSNCGRRGTDIARRDDANRQETGRDESDRKLGAVRELVLGAKGPDSQSIGRGSGQLSERGASKFAKPRNNCSPSSDPSSLHGQRFVREISDSKKRQEPSERQTGPQNNGVGWWSIEPDVDRVAAGIPARMDRARCIGMSQVPAVVKLAWQTLAP